MSLRILPVIGSSGFYELAAPFDALVVDSVEYTCQAIRRISDCLANNEDVKADIYTKHGIATIYDEDVEENAYIVSLQSRTGHWLYVPHRYILTYPSVNGIPYRSMMLGVSLPALPASQDLSDLLTELKDITDARLGVLSVARAVETSKITLIPLNTHIEKKIERDLRKAGDATQHATIVRLRRENDLLLQKVSALEAYIQAHPQP